MTSDVPVFDSVSSAVCEFDAVTFAVIEFDDETTGVIEVEGVESEENVLDGVTTSLVGESEAELRADTVRVCVTAAVHEDDIVCVDDTEIVGRGVGLATAVIEAVH